MLKLGALLVRRLGLKYERVYAASDLSVPLAVTVARLLGAEAAPFDAEKSEPGLVVAKNTDELKPHGARFVEHGELDLFCLCLDWTRNQPLAPDLVGFFARHSYLPWEGRHEVAPDESGRPAAIKPPAQPDDLGKAAQNLIAIAERLDVKEEIGKLEQYYRPRREHLVLGQPDRYPRRRVFSAHSPIVSDERIF
jgi:hypothetical protein